MTAPWRLLRTGPGEPAFNLALDEALLTSSGALPVLRLYAWDPPALSLGWFQPAEPFRARVPSDLIIVRRPTGGGAIHHADELTFALMVEAGTAGYPSGIVPAYERVHAWVAGALDAVGAPVSMRGSGRLSTRPRDAAMCFEDTTALDLVDAAGLKLVGSAQRRIGQRVLHHGSIPLTVPALSPNAGAVSLAAGRDVSWDEMADALVAGFTEDWGPLQPDRPTPQELRAAEKLVLARAADPTQTPRRR